MSVRGVVLLFIAAAVAVHLGGSVPYVPDPFSLYLRKLIPPSGRPFRVTACGAEMNARDALDRGDHAAAVQELARLILLAPGAIEPRRALASVYLSEQEFEPSLQQFRWLLARATPYGDEVLFQLTWAHQGLGQTQEALKFSQELVERCPQWSAAWVRRGLLLASDDPKASREAFFQALSCPFPDPEGLLEIGNYFLEQGAPRDSLPFFERCLSFPLQGSFAANNLGNAHKSLKDSSRARHYYEMAIGLNSKNPNPHNGLGVIAEEEGQLEKALGLYRRAMAADPSYLDAHYNAGVVSLKLKRPADAVRYLGEARALRPDFGLIHFYLTEALVAAGKLGQARESYAKAIALDPELRLLASPLSGAASLGVKKD